MFVYLFTIFSFQVTFPLDITKTRLQIQGERASTVHSTTTANVPYRGMVRTAVGIGEKVGTLLYIILLYYMAGFVSGQDEVNPVF